MNPPVLGRGISPTICGTAPYSFWRAFRSGSLAESFISTASLFFVNGAKGAQLSGVASFHLCHLFAERAGFGTAHLAMERGTKFLFRMVLLFFLRKVERTLQVGHSISSNQSLAYQTADQRFDFAFSNTASALFAHSRAFSGVSHSFAFTR